MLNGLTRFICRFRNKALKFCFFVVVLLVQYIYSSCTVLAIDAADSSLNLPFDMLDTVSSVINTQNTFTTIAPSLKPQISIDGNFDIESIQSYKFINNLSSLTYCSQIAYLNIQHLAGSEAKIVRGNAIDIRTNTKNPYYSGSLLQSIIDAEYITRHDTIYDIVTFLPKAQTQKDSDAYLSQAHRFVIVHARDAMRYVLDPLRSGVSDPILLDKYISQYLGKQERIKIIHSYAPSPDLEKKEVITLSTGSLSVDVSKDIVIKKEDSTMVTPSSLKINRLPSLYKKIPVIETKDNQRTFSADLIVDGKRMKVPMIASPIHTISGQTSINKKNQNQTTTDSQKTSIFSNEQDVTEHQFQFGLSGKHLKFSEAVKITEIVDFPEGALVSLGVKHGTQKVFGTEGLSVDPTTQCNDGQATLPGSQAIVLNGRITFWTCGASTFSLTYTGGASAANFVDGGYKDFIVSFATGVQFPTGALVADVNVAIKRRPIDNESATGPWGTTQCYPEEKGFDFFHPDGTMITVIQYQTGAITGQLTTPSTNCPIVTDTFDDEATTTISTSYATGNYRPVYAGSTQPLSLFDQKSPFGNRKLRVYDTAGLDGVILYGFTITIQTINPTPNISKLLWLRADGPMTVVSGGVSIWNDQSGRGKDVTQPTITSRPTLNTGGSIDAMNFNPTVKSYPGKQLFNLSGILGDISLKDLNVFFVTKLNTIGVSSLFFSEKAYPNDFSVRFAPYLAAYKDIYFQAGYKTSQVDIASSIGKSNLRSLNMHAENYLSLTGSQNISKNALIIASVNFDTLPYGFGGINSGFYLGNVDGNIAEILVYGTGMATGDINNTESYLAIKYGITLDQSGSGQNYKLTGNIVARDKNIAGVYKNDIAGIARVDTIPLLQSKSQSANSTSELIVEANSPLVNNRTLTWGNNGSSLASFVSSSSVVGVQAILPRIWKFQENNGDTASLTITSPLSNPYAPNTGESHVMLIDDDGIWGSGTTIVTGVQTATTGIWKYIANISGGAFVSFGVSVGQLCISSPDSMVTGLQVSNMTGIYEHIFDYFIVSDRKGRFNGYYTTISLGDLTSAGGNSIDSGNIEYMAEPIQTLSGEVNPNVLISPGLSGGVYVKASLGVRSYIQRNMSSDNRKGMYGSKLHLKLTISPYQSLGVYSGTLTYTLYEN